MKFTAFFLAAIFSFINLSAQSFGGTLASSTLVCSGSNNGILSVSGYSGAINRWECSNNVNGPWTPLIFTSSSYNYINLIQSTYFRVVVQMPGYPEAISNTILVSCDNLSSGGTILGNTLQCLNTPVTATLSNNTGSVVCWEYSSTNWITTNTITTTNTLVATLASLSTTTQIRVRVKNGVCPAVYSNTLNIIPAANSLGGSIIGTQSVCAVSNAATLSLVNHTGQVQYWESAISVGGPFNLIANTTNSISFTNLNQTTWYRAVVKNSNCESINSSLFPVYVDQASNGGSIIGTQSVCAGANSGTIQLLGSAGIITHWQNSINNGSTWSNITNTANTLSFLNISANSVYRAFVQNGICPMSTSSNFSVNVYQKPFVNFLANNSCVQTAIGFTNTSSGSTSYLWDFGDGSVATNYTPSHIYSSAGSFTVKLIAISSQNCSDSIKQILTIHPKPNANFISSDTSCFGNSVQFINASTISSGILTSLQFNFNDGSPSAFVSPVMHQYLSEGNFSTSLKVTSNFGCVDSINRIISIYPKPSSNFYAANVCKGSLVHFNNLSFISNGFLQHAWDYGNSIISSLPSPNYSYPIAGTYTVRLISNSNHNCKDTMYKTITINEKPSITFSSSNACLGNPVTYSFFTIPSISNYSLTMNFGDGNSSSSFDSSHFYLSPGAFASSITIVTDSGCVSTAIKNVIVYSKPQANFYFNNVCSSDSAIFINMSSIATGHLSYIWNLGNTVTDSTNSPKHLYSSPGNYSVSLIAKSDFDCYDTITKLLSIYEAPKADFNFNNVCDGYPISFTNTSTSFSGGNNMYVWSFGDNSLSTETHPLKEYLNNGTYHVSLITTSSEGCRDTIKKVVTLFERPIANFSADKVCINLPTTFSNTTVLKTGSYSSFWSFGDLISDINNSPTHIYNKSGVYTVWLKVSSNSNCVDSVSRFVESYGLPEIKASRDTIIEKGFGVVLEASGGLRYDWFPTIGLNDPTNAKPFAKPDNNTLYIVEGTDMKGCKNRDTLQVVVKNEFVVIPYNVLTPDGNGLNDSWVVKNIETYPENSLIIFNAWNQKVYEKEGYASDWVGENMRGEILPDGTYYYILTFKNTSKTYSGYITLLRHAE